VGGVKNGNLIALISVKPPMASAVGGWRPPIPSAALHRRSWASAHA